MRSRLPQLDVLRGLAILLVLCRHGVDWHYAGHLRPLGWALESFGWSGVDLFFVLSGFLVGDLLLDEVQRSGSLDVKRFMIRRAFKLWPGYIAMLAAAIVLQMYAEPAGFGAALYEFRFNFAHVQNYFSSPQIHTWSLAIEEHFYLVLPLVVLATRRRLSRMPYILVGCCVVCLGLRIYNATGPFDDAAWFKTHLRLDSLAFGVLLAYLKRFRPAIIDRVVRQRLVLVLAAALLSSALLLPVDDLILGTLGLSFVYVGYGLVLIYVLYARAGWVVTRPARALAWVGVYSYSIYLWHIIAGVFPVEVLIRPRLDLPPTLGWVILMAIDLTLAIGAGVVMAKLIEKPALALRERLFPSRVESI